MTNGTVLSGGRPARRGIARGPSKPSGLWLCLASAWLVFVFIPNGVTAWIGFAVIGALVRRRQWLIAAPIYLVATVAVTFLLTGVPQFLAGLVLYIVGFIHGMVGNRTWLTTLWGRIERGDPVFGRAVPEAVAVDPSSALPAEADAVVGATTEFFDAAAAPTAPIDVNEAGADELVAVVGLSRADARRAVAQRETRPYTSVQQFADAVGLQPHEFARVRDQLVCVPRPSPRPRGGRRIDL